MKKIRHSLFATLCTLPSLALPLTAQAELALKPGLWEYQMTMQMAGMPTIPGIPGMGGAPITISRCLTAEDTKDPGRALQESIAQQQCTQENFKNAGNKVSFNVRCTGEPGGTGRAEFTVAEEHFEGTMTMNMVDKRMGSVAMSQVMSGKRLGDCKK